MFAFTASHTAHLAISGTALISIAVFGLMPSGIWYTGILNSIMRSLGVILGGAAISVGDDNVRSGNRAGLTEEDLARLLIALKETGLTVKSGSEKETEERGAYELTSHLAWRDQFRGLGFRF